MQIIVFKDVQPQEDDSVIEMWAAQSAKKQLGGQARTPQRALKDFIRWLLLSLDEDNDQVPEIDKMVTPEPYDPEAGPSVNDSKVPEETWLSWIKDDGLIHPPSYPLYPDAHQDVVSKFNAGEPYAPDGVDIPKGWDVRIFKG